MQTSKNIDEKKIHEANFLVLVLVLLDFGQSLTTKCVSVNIQPCMVRPSCNTVQDPFDRICVPNKIQDVDLEVFN